MSYRANAVYCIYYRVKYKDGLLCMRVACGSILSSIRFVLDNAYDIDCITSIQYENTGHKYVYRKLDRLKDKLYW